MTTATPTPTRSPAPAEILSEDARVVCWRLAVLSKAGYSDEAAAVLAVRLDVNLHRATDLAARGCPFGTALDILL